MAGEQEKVETGVAYTRKEEDFEDMSSIPELKQKKIERDAELAKASAKAAADAIVVFLLKNFHNYTSTNTQSCRLCVSTSLMLPSPKRSMQGPSSMKRNIRR